MAVDQGDLLHRMVQFYTQKYGVSNSKNATIISVNKSFTYTLTPSTRTRTIRLSVHHDGRVTVTAPSWVSQNKVDRFVEQKRVWVERKLAQFARRGPLTVVEHARKDEAQHREVAHELAVARVVHFSRHYGYKVGRITIRDQKSRWGSCSKKGNLNFSYKIALLPQHLADYIVVHELCHIGQFNHSKAFWSLVGEMIPNHKECREQLKRTVFKHNSL